MPPRSLVAAFFVACLMVFNLIGCGSSGSDEQSLRRARVKVAAGDLDEAMKLAKAVSANSPVWPDAQAVVGDILMQRGEFADALKVWTTVLKKSKVGSNRLHLYAGQCCRELGRLSDAEVHFRQALDEKPHDRVSQNLAFIYCLSGRPWMAQQHFENLISNGSATLADLALLADLERPVEQRAFLEECFRKAPGDRVVQLGLAAHEFWEGHAATARPKLQALLEEWPTCSAAKAMLGELLLDQELDEFRQWHSRLDANDTNHPGIWYVRGLFARKHDRHEVAADCFRKSLEFAPSHRRSAYQLSQTLRAMKHPAADDFGDYAERLMRLSEAVDDVLRSEGRDPNRISVVASLLDQTGRGKEAVGWAQLVVEGFPNQDWAPEFIAKHQSAASVGSPLIVRGETPLPLFPLEATVDFHSIFASLGGEKTPAPSPASVGKIRFDASLVTVPFQFQNGHDSNTPGARMFEQTGGGVSVLDVDLDGWPDMFFAQGGHKPQQSSGFVFGLAETDTLYRNRKTTFADVSLVSVPPDIGFGQGSSAGDIDNDGFPDLYVGNIGANQLLHNMGDGTFLEASDRLGSQPPTEWTASTAIADLNNDGAAELIDVNYLTGDGILTAICNGKACSPSVFEAAPDHLLINQGDGTFYATDGTAGSKGLGCVVYRSAEDDKVRIFISNDQVANVQMEFAPHTETTKLQVIENAMQSGLALNEDGLSMGCMGIAADDITGNGQVDLFVTNFKDEANTLYLQDAPGFFVDRTRTSGLFSSGFSSVGWGTQFLDADCDGLSDIVVANGHVDDYRDEGGEFHMLPLFFRNLGRGMFEQQDVAGPGGFFQTKYLGRGLSRFDWNRDGAMDFVVSNIRQPAAIVTNTSEKPGYFFNVRLHGTRSSRDAIGTIVSVTTANNTLTKQLTGGDGYMATNERVVQFGLAAQTEVDRLEIIWPSGTRFTADRLPANVTVHIVEGRGAVYRAFPI